MWLVTDYKPSPDLVAALADYQDLQERTEAARLHLRNVVAAELRAYDVTNEALAEHLPWTGETVRGIAREHGIPPKRKPTVRSIKTKRRTTA